jgi:sigma-B regulation protein RsbQ
LLEGLGLHDVLFVGHSVSSMIGLLAAVARPERFRGLVMIAATARYLNDPATGYVGGLDREQVTRLLQRMETQPRKWAAELAELAVDPAFPECRRELERLFSTTWPPVARQFAHATFNADCRDDPFVPEGAAAYLAAHLPAATHVKLASRGHCPHLTAPCELAQHVRALSARLSGGRA